MTARDGATDTAAAPLRRDAERNRELILEAARQVSAEKGLGAPIDEVARRAGVGVATLYRRFPTRPELIACAFGDKMTAYADAIDEALSDVDPWNGFRLFVERVCQMQADDHGFADVLTLTFPMAPQFQAERDRGYRNMVTLIRRAQTAGALRKDFVPEDIPLLLMATSGVINATGDAAPDAWRRMVAFLLQAFAAPGGGALPPPPTPDQTYRAMQRLQPPR